MRKAILLLVIVFITLAVWGEEPETFELSNTDLITMGSKVASYNLTVRGVNVDMKMPEVLKKLGKTEADYQNFGIVYKIIVEPGFEIITNKKVVWRFHITGDFKDLKGKTIDFFKFQNKDEVRNFLKQHVGSPAKTIGLVDFVKKNNCEFIYENGITYHYMLKDGKPASMIRIIPIAMPIQAKKEIKSDMESKKEIPKLKKGEFDLRNVIWGMSKGQVKSAEKSKLLREMKTALLYGETIFGMDVILGYYFSDNKLMQARYMFSHKHTNKNDYIDDYKQIKAALIKKYGKPDKDVERWKNDLYKDKIQEWGFAVSLGHLVYLSIWEVGRSDIGLLLDGDNYKIRLSMQFDSKVVVIKEQDESDKF